MAGLTDQCLASLSKISRSVALAVLATLAALLLPASAGVIDFETRTTGSVSTDDAVLTGSYAIDGGGTVKFFFDTNGNNTFDQATDVDPVFEVIGSDAINGFLVSTVSGQTADAARPGYQLQLGDFFLRQSGGNNSDVPGPFIIAYNTTQTIRALSGEIWDIDGGAYTERWRVDVLNGSGQVLATTLSPLGVATDLSSLDGLPWTFSFTALPDGVAAVRLTFTGSKPTNIGLAFNNFSATTALPEPASAGFLLAGGCVLTLRRRARPGRS